MSCWTWQRKLTLAPILRNHEIDPLIFLSSYVQFYLDLVATSENISLLYHLAQKGKTVRDPESHSSSEVSPFLLASLTVAPDAQVSFVKELLCDVRTGSIPHQGPGADSVMDPPNVPWQS